MKSMKIHENGFFCVCLLIVVKGKNYSDLVIIKMRSEFSN